MDRHHSEYIRKVRVQKYQRDKKIKHKTQPMRQSERTTAHSKEIEALKAIISEKDQQIDALSAMLDTQTPAEHADKQVQAEEDVIETYLLLGP